jgi:hypothetical protein
LIFCIVLAKKGKVKGISKNTRFSRASLKACRICESNGPLTAIQTKIDPGLRARAKASNIELNQDTLRNTGYAARSRL